MNSGMEVPVSVWEGSFRLFGVEVRCHTLSDGRRIIETDSLRDLLNAMATEKDADGPGELEAFSRWQRGEATQ